MWASSLSGKKKTNSSLPSKYNNLKSVEGNLYTTIVVRTIVKRKKNGMNDSLAIVNSEKNEMSM